MKKLLTLAALAAAIVPISDAHASERISVHEINKFVRSFDEAINNPDVLVGRSFLSRNLVETASLQNSIQLPWHQGYNAVRDTDRAYVDYYRYPYAYSLNYRPSSMHVENKSGIISNFQSKKQIIPGFKQETKVTSTTMPADAQSAIVDVDLKEFGVRYVGHNPGFYPGYHPIVAQNVLNTDSKCKMYLGKQNSKIKLKHMICNSVSHLPY